LQRGRARGGGQRPEQRDRRGGCPVAGGLDRDEVQRDGVPRLCSFHKKGARLWVHEGELDNFAHEVAWSPNLAPERVLGPQLHDSARTDRPYRFSPAEGPRELGWRRTVGLNLQIAHGSFESPSSARVRCPGFTHSPGSVSFAASGTASPISRNA